MFCFTKLIYWARVQNRCAPLPFPTAPPPGSRLISLTHPHPLCTCGGAIMALRLPPNPSLHPCPSVRVHRPGLGCALCGCHIGDGVPPPTSCCGGWTAAQPWPFPLRAAPLHTVLTRKWGRRTWDRAGNGGVRGWWDSIPLASLTQDEGGKCGGGHEPEGEGGDRGSPPRAKGRGTCVGHRELGRGDSQPPPPSE